MRNVLFGVVLLGLVAGIAAVRSKSQTPVSLPLPDLVPAESVPALPLARPSTQPVPSTAVVTPSVLQTTSEPEFHYSAEQDSAIEEGHRLEEGWKDMREQVMKELNLPVEKADSFRTVREAALARERALADSKVESSEENLRTLQQMTRNRREYLEKAEQVLGSQAWHTLSQRYRGYWEIQQSQTLHSTHVPLL